MFNVYPVEIQYIRTAKEGVLAGIACPCHVGVESEVAGQKLFDDLVKNNPDATFSNLNIVRKK